MAEHGMGISLSHSSDDESSDQQTPYTGGSGGAGGGCSSHRQTPPSGITPSHHWVADAPPPSKKPRGRPPGSKNKPKPPVVITQDNDKAMKPVVMMIGAGTDVMDSIISFARRRNAGITVLSGSGSVSKVTLCHPFSHTTPAFTLHGPFTLLALTGSYLSPPIHSSLAASASSSSSSPNPSSTFGISFSGAQGQIFGGVVGGKVVSGNNGVVLVTSLIKNPEVHKVAGVDEDDCDEGDNPNNQGGGGAAGAGAGAGAGDTMFNPTPLNSQVPSDANVMQWGQSAARHPSY